MSLEIRKIGTKKDAERKSQRNTIIFSIVMISILVFSTAGYFSMREDDTGANTGSKGVQNIGGAWYLNYGGNKIRLSNSPESTENVSVTIFKRPESYVGKTLYIASEYDSGLYEVNLALQDYAERIHPACYGTCTKDLPEKNCNDTMIVISRLNVSEREKGKVYEQDNCVFIEGNIDAVDAFLYHIFGVN